MKSAFWVLFVCASCLFQFSCGLEGNDVIQLRPPPPLPDIQQFGFAAGGYISLKTSAFPPQENLSLYICTDKEFDILNSIDPNDNSMSFCNNPGYYCEYIADHSIEVSYHVKTKNRYHIVLVQCGSRDSIKVQVQYKLLNPGGEQLPVGEIPLPKLYILVTCIWTLLVTLCIFVWSTNREHVVILHGLLYAVGVFKLAVVIVALCYWHIYQITGRDIVQLKYLQSFIYALSETAFFCSLLLISKGWRITRSNLPPSEIRTISVALVLLLSTLLFFSFYNDGYYFLSLMIMYFFMLPKIFTSITRNTRALHTHMLLARYANIELNTEPILAKIKMFKTLRTAVILYLGSILIISSMKIIMWWFLVWVTFCVSELVTIVMVVAVWVITRPRLNGVFSSRAYFESGSFPVLNMQQFDHFDELFGDQIWDPDLVFGSSAAAAALHNNNNNGHPIIDMSEAIVIEYPAPQFSKGETSYFPRLAIATLEKDKEKEKEKEVEERGKGRYLRRRGTSSSSSSSSPSLANSTSALLPRSSSGFSLSSASSSSPLLLSPPSMPSITYEDLDIDIVVPDSDSNDNDNINEDEIGNIELVARSRATQTSPPPNPTHSSTSTSTSTSSTSTSTSSSSSSTSTPFSSSSSTTTTTTSIRSDSPINNKDTKNSNTTTNNNNTTNNSNNTEEQEKASNCTTTTTTTNRKTSKPAPPIGSKIANSAAFNSSTSLLSQDDDGEGRKDDDDELM